MRKKVRDTYRVIGKELSNDQVYGKVTGAIKYCSDMQSVGMLHMKLKGSTVAHGKITAIHTEEAEKMEGVKAVFTYQNTPDTCYDRGRVERWEKAPYQERLFDQHIRFMGERVAAVVAVSEKIAKAACEKILVEYEEYPPLISVEEAEKGIPFHKDGNVYHVSDADRGDYKNARADYTFRNETHIGRMAHLQMETQAGRAVYDKSSKRLTVWSGCQTVFGVRSTLAEFLGMHYSKIRVIKPPMGGSFGGKQETLIDPLIAYAAVTLGADVRLVYTREEQFVNTIMKQSLDGVVESKVNADGTIQGLSVACTLDAGGYLTVSQGYADTIGSKIGNVYNSRNIHFEGKAVCTNTPINGSFRSWGSGEATLLLENHWNMVARKLNMDPIDFRLKNVLHPYDIDVMHHVSVEQVHFEECLNMGRDAFRWDERKESCRRKNQNQERYRYGVGVAIGSHTSSFYPYRVDIATSLVRLQEDGSLIVNVGIHDHGCGSVMAMKKIAAEVMELDIDAVEVNEADTLINMYDYGCYASRTVYSLGAAVKDSCEHLLEKAADVAAAILRCSQSFLCYENGEFYMEMEPEKRVTLAEAVEYSIHVIGKELYHVSTLNAQANPGVSGAHFTQVKVDTYTGHVEVEAALSIHDIGKAINPDLCRGQVGSGIQQGMGMALCEDIKIHPTTGQTLITNFKNYEVANICDVPDYQVIFIEEGEKTGPFGAKSIGEVVIVPVAPAIVSAVNEALGTELTHLPLTPPAILEALEEKDNEN